jgi:hypothetical protein
MFKKFEVKDKDELVNSGFSEYDDSWYEYTFFLVALDDQGKILEVLGQDGGEPEDQTLNRDWSWVPTLLNKEHDFYQNQLALLQEKNMQLSAALEAANDKSSQLTKPKDFLSALKEIERKDRYNAIYHQEWENALLSGMSREEAHQHARQACVEAGVMPNNTESSNGK